MTKITPFTIHTEAQQDYCSSFQTNLEVLVTIYVFLPLSMDTEGDDKSEEIILLLCMHTQQK